MKERTERLMNIMNCLTQIVFAPAVEKSCPEAVERYDYLLRHGSIFYPIREKGDISLEWFSPISLMDYEGRRMRGWKDLKIYPSLPKDALLGPVAEYVTKTEIAAYGASKHYIIVNVSSCETDRFMATAILHEIGHAIAAEKEKRAFRSVDRILDERLREEMDLWSFDCRLLTVIGGKEFAEATDSCVSEIYYRLLNSESPICIQFGPNFGAPLDYCYGTPPNEKSRENRKYTYEIYCSFEIADRYIKDHYQRLAFLTQVIRATYQNQLEKREEDIREAIKKQKR